MGEAAVTTRAIVTEIVETAEIAIVNVNAAAAVIEIAIVNAIVNVNNGTVGIGITESVTTDLNYPEDPIRTDNITEAEDSYSETISELKKQPNC